MELAQDDKKVPGRLTSNVVPMPFLTVTTFLEVSCALLIVIVAFIMTNFLATELTELSEW